MKLVTIPAGEFSMGSNDETPMEQPVSRVRIDRPFMMGATEVTLRQYRQFDPDYLNGAQHLTDGETGKHRYQRAQRTDWNDNRYCPDGKPAVKAIKRPDPASTAHCRIQEPRVSGKRHASRSHDDDKHCQACHA
jgi:formylglycine-generating enzyme required for sulfatase activity